MCVVKEGGVIVKKKIECNLAVAFLDCIFRVKILPTISS